MLTKYFFKKHKGAFIFEAVLITPVILILVGLCLFFLILIMSWTSYGSLASELASDLNLRSTGLSVANASVPSGNIVMNGSTGDQDYPITKYQFSINGLSEGNKVLNSYKNALITSALHYKNQFYMPFCEFRDCNADVLQLGRDGTYNIDISETSTLSNYIVKVTINYTFKPFTLFDFDLGAINVQTIGYSVVT